MIPLVAHEDLGLVLQATEGGAVNHPVPVPLEIGAIRMWILPVHASPAPATLHGVRGQGPLLLVLKILSEMATGDHCHSTPISDWYRKFWATTDRS